jgi:hypothetical protein
MKHHDILQALDQLADAAFALRITTRASADLLDLSPADAAAFLARLRAMAGELAALGEQLSGYADPALQTADR